MAGSVTEPRWQQFKDQSYSQILVILAGASGPPTTAYCTQIKADYGLTYPVVIDPTGQLKNVLGLSGDSHHSIVLGSGGSIVFNEKYANQMSVDAAIQNTLAQ